MIFDTFRVVVASMILLGAIHLSLAQFKTPHNFHRISQEARGLFWIAVGLSWASVYGIYKVLIG